MTEEEILTRVSDLARRRFGVEKSLLPEMRLAEDVGLDSFRMLTLAVEIENEFEICLSEEAEAEIVTIADLVETVRGQIEGRGQGVEG